VLVCFTTSGDDLDAPFDARFGRAPKYLIYDTENNTFRMADNSGSAQASHGAGIQAAQAVANLGVKAVVTGHCGPKAFRALNAAGVDIYNTNAATVAEALEAFSTGALKPVGAPDVAGHWA
jgi:predicted Fe-Mo cluster-binding NifX family protein